MKAMSVRNFWYFAVCLFGLFTLTGCPIPKPRIVPPAGVYNCPTTVTITASSAGAQLYYTVDGSTPSSSSKKYSGPFAVDSTQNVQAIAVGAAGTKYSDIASIAYTCTPMKLTRADFAKAIRRQFDLPQPSPAISFGDVKPGDPIYPAAEAIAPYMHRQLLCPGCHLSPYFSPTGEISRAEAAVIFVSILITEHKVRLPTLAEANTFLSNVADVKDSPKTARQYIVAAIENRLLTLNAGQRIDGDQPYSQTDMNVALAEIQHTFRVPPNSPQ